MDFKSIMKNLLIILLAIVFSSCNPFISKDLRRKNKCNRKLERVIRKCPELLKQDTAVILYDTIIITPSYKVDTVVSLQFDTITIIKDKLRLKLIRISDTLLVDAECIPDTIRIKQYIKVPCNTVSNIELSVWDKIMNGIGRFWWWIIAAIILFILYKLAGKFLNNIF